MSSEIKFENHSLPDEKKGVDKGRVKLTDLVSRLNQEKKRERLCESRQSAMVEVVSISL